MDFRLLGPMQVWADGREITLSAGKHRALLAVLLLRANQMVPTDYLVSTIWGEEPPGDARATVQTYVGRLRRALGDPGLIRTRPSGYLISVAADQLDVARFDELVRRADLAADPATEASLLASAVALWRGPALADVPSDVLHRDEVPALVERRLRALERWIELQLRDGRHAELIPELRSLIAENPLRERLWAQLMTALAGCGRPGEALQTYEDLRGRLAEHLGIDPSAQLQQLHRAVLRGEAAATSTEGAPRQRWLRPAQLPANGGGFVGREKDLSQLRAVLESRGTGAEGPSGMPIVAISGTAGVGKTAFAVHWAHQVADRFPDGQLYADLRGFHPSGNAMPPSEAIRSFLGALGVPPERVPSDLDSQVGLYRSRLAGRRILVLLDNARDADQLRPLLPGNPACLAVVTSRDELTSLVATEGARLVVLDLLPPEEAHAMLALRLGADRLAAEPAAVEEIITRCARLPLALAIVAARATTRPGHPLEAIAADLREPRAGSLTALTTGDASTDIQAVFSWSYRTLSPAAARLFGLLGLHPGPDIGRPAAASLAGLPERRVRVLLDELTRVHLLSEQRPGRYTFHDLLRAFAAELGEAQDPEEVRHARGRMLDHYLHTAHAGAALQSPGRHPIRLAGTRPGVVPEPLADDAQATGWFATERAVLIAAVHQAYRTGFDAHAWQLAWTLTTFLDRRGEWRELTATQRVALAAAERLGDLEGEAYTYRNLAVAHVSQGRYEEARADLERALDLFGQLGDLPNQARTRLGLGQAAIGRGHHAEALAHVQAALRLYRAGAHRAGEAEALNGIAWCYAQLGEHEAALEHGEQALALTRALDDRPALAAVLDTLGYAHHHLGNHEQAVKYYHETLDLFRQLGEARFMAEVFVHLGDAHLTAGKVESARAALRRALAIFEELDHPHAARVRDRLAGLP